MNRLLAPLLLFAVPHAFTQALDQPVTYRTTATSVQRAVKAISDLTKVKLETEKPLAGEVVVIQVEKVPLKQLMAKLASTLAGKWVEKDGVQKLVLDPVAAKAQEQAELKTKAQEIVKAMAAVDKDLKAYGPFTRETAQKAVVEAIQYQDEIQRNGENVSTELWEKRAKATQSAPAGRLLRRLIMQLNPYDLAALEVGQRVVYSTRPTQMQRPLPFEAEQALSDFVEQYAIWSEVVKAIPKVQDEEGFGSFVDPDFSAPPLKAPIAKALLSVQRYPVGAGATVEMYVADTTGRVIARQEFTLGEPTFMEVLAGKEAPKKHEDPELKRQIKFSEDSVALMKVFDGAVGMEGMSPAPLARLSPELRNKILHPEEYEPLGYAASDFALGLADAKGKPFLAVLPDGIYGATAYLANGGATNVGDALEVAGTMGQMEVKETDGWTILVSREPAAARYKREDRKLMGELIRTAMKQGNLTLDQLSDYVTASPQVSMESLTWMFLYGFIPNAMQGFDFSNWDMLRFYGSLGDDLKLQLMNKEALRIGGIGPEAQARLASVIFGRPNMSTSFDMSQFIDDPAAADQTFFYGTLGSEPTEVLPYGLPGDGAIRLEASTEIVASAASGALPYRQSLSAAELGQAMAMKERPDLYPWSVEMPSNSQFKLGSRITLNFQFYLAPKLTVSQALMDFRAAEGKLYAIKDLPPEFLKEVHRAKEEMLKAQKDMKPEDMARLGSERKPPPG